MQRAAKWTLLAAGCLIAAQLAVQELALGAPAKAPAGKGNAATGKLLFERSCAMCHGAGAKGNPAMKTIDFTKGKFTYGSTDAALTKVIQNGAPKSVMSGFKKTLSAQDITNLIAYIRSVRK
jgi:cbb3-type cytochrome c oxidase subunit III